MGVQRIAPLLDRRRHALCPPILAHLVADAAPDAKAKAGKRAAVLGRLGLGHEALWVEGVHVAKGAAPVLLVAVQARLRGGSRRGR